MTWLTWMTGPESWDVGRRCGGVLVATSVARWSLLSWRSGRCGGGLIAAEKFGCAGWGACDNLQRSGSAMAG